MTNPPDPTLEALWKRVLDDWDGESAHAAFLEYCRASERLVEAAVRYRGMSGDRARAEIAEKKLKAVAALAMTQLESSRTSPSPTRSQRGAFALIAFFVVATIGLLAYLASTR